MHDLPVAQGVQTILQDTQPAQYHANFLSTQRSHSGLHTASITHVYTSTRSTKQYLTYHATRRTINIILIFTNLLLILLLLMQQLLVRHSFMGVVCAIMIFIMSFIHVDILLACALIHEPHIMV